MEEEPYLLELVRYLHLNPLWAKVVPDLRTLERYPWTGHSAVLGTVPRPWQDTGTILAQFGPTRRRARQAYRTFVQEGVAHARRPDLQGGGLVRSLGGWDAVRQLRRGREAYLGDERILGSPAFVETVRREVEHAVAAGSRRSAIALKTVMARVCDSLGIVPAALVAGGRTARVSRAREGIAYLWVTVLGHAGRRMAAPLGIRPQNVYRAAAQGAAAAATWQRILLLSEKLIARRILGQGWGE